jgi:hypothetical protein
MDEDREGIHWNDQLERILSNEGERALCFSWLHNHAQKRYSRFDDFVVVPVMFLSLITGFLSASTGTVIPSNTTTSAALGAMSVFIGMLNSIGSKYAWAKRSEGHKIAAMTYSKLYKFIVIELTLPRKERMTAGDMLKVIREQLERLAETSPQVPEDSIKAFNLKFEHSTPDISKPEITNGLDPIIVYGETHIEKQSSSSTSSPSSPRPTAERSDMGNEIRINVVHDSAGIPSKMMLI